MPNLLKSAFILALMLGASPLAAKVVERTEDRFVTRDIAVVKADLKATWLALIYPDKWWNADHTWTGDSSNLSLTPQAGGCFCERIPEVDEPDRFTLEGSVEHLRVVQAYPEKALRMVGALGPLQSEPVSGVLTIVLTKVDQGTQIVWEYNVGGPMRYETDVISSAVDAVMSQQLAGLSKMLGRVEMPEPEPKAAPSSSEGAKGEAKPANDTAAKGDAAPKPNGEARDEANPKTKANDKITIEFEDAFGDLKDNEPPLL